MQSQSDSRLIQQKRYSSVAIALHWLLAGALVFQLALGFAMPRGESGFAAYQLHKSVGIAILLLTIIRLAWRFYRRPPAPLEQGIGGLLASVVHWGFYAMLILGPLSGWVVVSAASVKVPTVLFGVVPWPHLPVSSALGEMSEEAHELIGWIGVGLIGLHVAGALRHHLILRDGLLARMAPGGAPGVVLALAALVALIGGLTLYWTGKLGQNAAPAVLTTQVDEQVQLIELEADEAPQAAPDIEPSPEATEAAESEAALPPTWAISPGGRLGFTIANGGEQLNGRFANWSGKITFDPDQPETADIRIDIDLASASLGDATMDSTLQGAEFFATASTPRATWRSTSVRKTGANRYAAQGTLSLKGASKPQSLTFTLSGTGLRRSVSGSATIDREAFGVGSGSAAANLGAQVSLNFAFDAVGKAG